MEFVFIDVEIQLSIRRFTTSISAMNSQEFNKVHVLTNWIFSSDEPDAVQPIPSLPGVSRFGCNKVIEHLRPLVAKGLSSVNKLSFSCN